MPGAYFDAVKVAPQKAVVELLGSLDHAAYKTGDKWEIIRLTDREMDGDADVPPEA